MVTLATLYKIAYTKIKTGGFLKVREDKRPCH